MCPSVYTLHIYIYMTERIRAYASSRVTCTHKTHAQMCLHVYLYLLSSMTERICELARDMHVQNARTDVSNYLFHFFLIRIRAYASSRATCTHKTHAQMCVRTSFSSFISSISSIVVRSRQLAYCTCRHPHVRFSRTKARHCSN